MLYIKNGHKAVDNAELAKLVEARERLDWLEKRAANKIIKAHQNIPKYVFFKHL